MSLNLSSKLLNYAKSVNGYLQLFTSLNHTFKVGDKIYILGGYYDNTDISDPFNAITYTVLSVDQNTNSFVIDYPTTTLSLIYPYGTLQNRFGDPQDLVNLAYNNYLNDDLYKSVYVSKSIFKKGRFKSGKINNGIFGTDTEIVKLSVNENATSLINQNNVVIEHIVSKNTEISKGIINSKTDSISLQTKKYEIIEDSSININNPYYPQQIAISNNNNGYGYSYFERFRNVTNTTNELTINNGEFVNPGHNYISLKDIFINRAKIGTSFPIYNDSLVLDNIIINSGELLNVTKNNLITGNNIKYSNYHKININNATLGGIGDPGKLYLNVDYADLANFLTLSGTILLYGPFNNIESYNYEYSAELEFFTVDSITYITGDTINNVDVELSFNQDVIDNWANFISLFNINSFDWSNVYITKFESQKRLLLNNCNIFATIYSSNCYIENSNMTGVFNEITYNNCNVNSYNNMYTVLQYCINKINYDTIFPITINTQYIFNNVFLLNSKINNKTLFIDSYIRESDLTKCILNNSIVSSKNPNNLDIAGSLYNCTINDSFIDDTVNTIGCRFTQIGQIVDNDGVTIINRANYNGRRTPWVTYIGGLQSSLITPNTQWIPNGKDYTSNFLYYGSQYIVELNTSVNNSHLPRTRMTYQVPNLENVVSGILNSDIYSIYFYNYVASNVFDTTVFNVHSGTFFNNAQLLTKLQNRLNQTTSGIIDPRFTGVTLPPATSTDLVEVDENYLIDIVNSPYPVSSRNVSVSNVYINTIPDAPDNFPDPKHIGNSDILSKFEIGIVDSIEGSSALFNSGDTVNLTNQQSEFSIGLQYETSPSVFVDNLGNPATMAPAPFVEVERVLVKYYSDNFITNTKNKIFNTNYIPNINTTGNKYNINNNILMTDLNNSFFIDSMSQTPYIPPIVEKDINENLTIDIELWITWFYYEDSVISTENPYLNGTVRNVYRSKHVLTFNVQQI